MTAINQGDQPPAKVKFYGLEDHLREDTVENAFKNYFDEDNSGGLNQAEYNKFIQSVFNTQQSKHTNGFLQIGHDVTENSPFYLLRQATGTSGYEVDIDQAVEYFSQLNIINTPQDNGQTFISPDEILHGLNGSNPEKQARIRQDMGASAVQTPPAPVPANNNNGVVLPSVNNHSIGTPVPSDNSNLVILTPERAAQTVDEIWAYKDLGNVIGMGKAGNLFGQQFGGNVQQAIRSIQAKAGAANQQFTKPEITALVNYLANIPANPNTGPYLTNNQIMAMEDLIFDNR